MSSSSTSDENNSRSLHLQQLMAQAKALKGRRTKENTQYLYDVKFKAFKEFIISFPELRLESIDEDNEIKLPIPIRTVEAFFAEVVKKDVVAVISNHIVAEGNTDDDGGIKLKALSTVRGYASAIKNYYIGRDHPWPDDLKQSLSQILAGHTRDIAALKKKGHMRQQEGKERITMEGYIRVCTKFTKLEPTSLGPRRGFEGEWRSGIFAWTYNILMWNLISRSIWSHGQFRCHGIDKWARQRGNELFSIFKKKILAILY